MNSEKVKEIKKSLQQEIHLTEYVDSAYSENVSLDLLKDVLDIINELETENEKLMKLQSRGGCRVAELGIENQQLKDRIAELESTESYFNRTNRWIVKGLWEMKHYYIIVYQSEVNDRILRRIGHISRRTLIRWFDKGTDKLLSFIKISKKEAKYLRYYKFN